MSYVYYCEPTAKIIVITHTKDVVTFDYGNDRIYNMSPSQAKFCLFAAPFHYTCVGVL